MWFSLPPGPQGVTLRVPSDQVALVSQRAAQVFTAASRDHPVSCG